MMDVRLALRLGSAPDGSRGAVAALPARWRRLESPNRRSQQTVSELWPLGPPWPCTEISRWPAGGHFIVETIICRGDGDKDGARDGDGVRDGDGGSDRKTETETKAERNSIFSVSDDGKLGQHTIHFFLWTLTSHLKYLFSKFPHQCRKPILFRST